MKIICPMCEKVLKDEPGGPSHVMCNECAEEYRRKVEDEVSIMEEEDRIRDALRTAFDIEQEDPK